MPLHFEDLCDLLEALELLETKQPPLLPTDKADRLRCTLIAWFKKRRSVIDRLGVASAVALLSTLLPERRPDRVYGLQAATLSRALCRGLSLGNIHITALRAYQEPGRGDLGQCLQRIVDRLGPPALPKVEVDEVDDLMDWLASQCRFSAPARQAVVGSSNGTPRDERIGHILKRLTARDAKWFVRLVLKDFSPVTLDERLLLKSMHFLLPDLLRFQQGIPAACSALRTIFAAYPAAPDPSSERLLSLNASASLSPQVGIKISRPPFTKARSIQHCLNMLGPQSWVIERKYDGEYCEIHIDLTLSNDFTQCIKIFSKNAKDATRDRQGIMSTLVSCLRLGQPGCKIRSKAILLAELVVWSDETGKVMPFEEIRKHVSRSGSFIGTKLDSRPAQHEHLSIVFFDILLLDDRLLLKDSVEKRHQELKTVYKKIPGRAKTAEWKVIDFSIGELSKRRLMEQFAASNAMACEGLVLKPCGVPYFSLVHGKEGEHRGFIKLKKDYIDGLGDEADFAVVGGSYVAQEAAALNMPALKYTRFHLGTVLNKDLVDRFQHKAIYKLVGSISAHMCIPKPVLEAANRLGFAQAIDRDDQNDVPEFDLEPGSSISNITLFRRPMVFEVLGSGYVKPSDCDFYMLRHPRVKKLHQDRSWKDCVGFHELQDLALKARSTGLESESQENRHELMRLEKSMRKKFERLSKTPSPVKRSPPKQLTIISQDHDRQALSQISGNANTASVSSSSSQQRSAAAHIGSLQKRRKLNSQSRVKTSPLNRRHHTIQTAGSHTIFAPAPNNNGSKHVFLSRKTCVTEECALSKFVICFTSCVASTPYVTGDLLECHAVTIVRSWKDWLRERPTHDEAVLGESQAYPGLTRVVIAEGRRASAISALVRDMLEYKDLARSDVEIWDWRLLEMVQGHTSSLDEHRDMLLGRLTWNRVHERMVYEENGLVV